MNKGTNIPLCFTRNTVGINGLICRCKWTGGPLEGLRGEESIAELCRREGIASSMYYGWSKEFLEADRKPPRIDPHGRIGSGTASQRLSGSQMVDLALDQPDSARGKWRCASRTRKNTLSQRLRSIGC
jgi:hypothetical protein